MIECDGDDNAGQILRIPFYSIVRVKDKKECCFAAIWKRNGKKVFDNFDMQQI